MSKKKYNNDNCILATDFSDVHNDMEIWAQKRDKKSEIYYAFGEYILCLEGSLECESDSYKKYLIKKEIKKLKKEQKKYYVPSVLEIAIYDGRKDKKSENTLEKSSFSLIKKF